MNVYIQQKAKMIILSRQIKDVFETDSVEIRCQSRGILDKFMLSSQDISFDPKLTNADFIELLILKEGDYIPLERIYYDPNDLSREAFPVFPPVKIERAEVKEEVKAKKKLLQKNIKDSIAEMQKAMKEEISNVLEIQ